MTVASARHILVSTEEECLQVKQKIEADARELNFLPRQAQLPI